jgi:tetratricopeptide (TPR) repeat protein
LLEQGRYTDLLALPEPASADTFAAAAEARAVTVRCRLEQGYVRRAADLARSAPPELLASGDAGASLRLWGAFADLHDAGDRPFAHRAAELVALCDTVGTGAGVSLAVAALAADVRSRAELIQFVLSGHGPHQRGSLVWRAAQVADGYRAAGQRREQLAVLRRVAGFAAEGLAADRDAARELLRRASREASETGLVVAQAHADLALAEADLRALLDGEAGREQATVLARFDDVMGMFRAGGHAFGDALVQWAVARLLLAYGNAAGIKLAHDAARDFAAADVPSSEYQVWSALRSWYETHGDNVHGGEAEAHVAGLVSGMGFPLVTEGRVLDEAMQAFRSGEVTRARSLLARITRSSVGLQAASRVMLATSANSVGLRAEAKQLLEEVVAELTETGASQLLGEALNLLAVLMMDSDEARALELLRRAAEVAHAAEAATEEAKYRGQLAWTMVTQRMRSGATPYVTAAADGEFTAAEALLKRQRTLEARCELARLCQRRGQVAFFDHDWDQVGTWLSKAETITRSLGLLPDLAFTLSYQGLAMVEVARRSGLAAYDQAARLLAESEGLFQRMGLPGFLWQPGFYRALCDIEAARRPQPDAERRDRLDRATGQMEQVAALIDQLRTASRRKDVGEQQSELAVSPVADAAVSEDAAVSGQWSEHAWSERPDASTEQLQRLLMAFGTDKQVFYGEGFKLAWDVRSDTTGAWVWLERMKAQALLDGLTGDGPDHVGAAEHRERSAARRSEPLHYTELRELLAAEEAAAGGRRVVVAEYLCTPERTIVFGARADWEMPQAAHIPLDHAALRRFAAVTFRTPGGVRMMMQDRADGGLAEWHRFAPLLAPLADWADPDDVVYLIPYGALHDLPLHTLPVGGQPLLERNPVCYVPAAAVLRHTLRGQRPAFTSGAAAVFGDSRADLPRAREEAETVAGLLGVTAATGEDVSRERVIIALRTATVLHVAGHGQLSTADGFASGLELADADTLRAGDLLGQPCAVRLAVLSGCDTGVSELQPGDEAVGLIRALLLSGVRTILASQWQVNDASTKDLLCRFHLEAREASVPLAEALRRAALATRDDSGFGHLYHWGGFTLAGSWR